MPNGSDFSCGSNSSRGLNGGSSPGRSSGNRLAVRPRRASGGTGSTGRDRSETAPTTAWPVGGTVTACTMVLSAIAPKIFGWDGAAASIAGTSITPVASVTRSPPTGPSRRDTAITLSPGSIRAPRSGGTPRSIGVSRVRNTSPGLAAPKPAWRYRSSGRASTGAIAEPATASTAGSRTNAETMTGWHSGCPRSANAAVSPRSPAGCSAANVIAWVSTSVSPASAGGAQATICAPVGRRRIGSCAGRPL